MAGKRKARLKPIEITADTGALLTQWYEASTQLKELAERESAYRMNLVTRLFDNSKLEGDQTIDLGGWRLKASKVQHYSATNDSGQTERLLGFIAGNDPALAAELVKWKPELSKTAYRKLLEVTAEVTEIQPYLAAAITVKPGMPTLELIPPKAE